MEYYNKKQSQSHKDDDDMIGHGPIIHVTSTKEWRMNGKRHREDGPAVIYPSGTKEWYINGKCHRTDGPAVEHIDDRQEWHINGNKLPDNDIPQTKEEWVIAILKYS